MLIPTPDVVSVFVDAVSLAIGPDALKNAKTWMLLLTIATSAPSDIPVLLKRIIAAFVNLCVCIVLPFKVRCQAEVI